MEITYRASNESLARAIMNIAAEEHKKAIERMQDQFLFALPARSIERITIGDRPKTAFWPNKLEVGINSSNPDLDDFRLRVAYGTMKHLHSLKRPKLWDININPHIATDSGRIEVTPIYHLINLVAQYALHKYCGITNNTLVSKFAEREWESYDVGKALYMKDPHILGRISSMSSAEHILIQPWIEMMRTRYKAEKERRAARRAREVLV